MFEGLAIDPVTYQRTHRVTDVDGDLNKLRGATVALSRGLAERLGLSIGAEVPVHVDGVARALRVVATLPESLGGPDVLVPIELRSAEHAELRYIVRTTPEGRAAVIRALVTLVHAGPSRVGEVLSVDEWVQTTVAASGRTDRDVLVALLALITVYTVVAVINAVVIGAAHRREEFATARLTGLRRRQVVGSALIEAVFAVAVGAGLGGAIAVITVASGDVTVSRIVGTPVVTLPWQLFGIVTAAAIVIVGVASVLTTLTATRRPPIEVAGAKR